MEPEKKRRDPRNFWVSLPSFFLLLLRPCGRTEERNCLIRFLDIYAFLFFLLLCPRTLHLRTEQSHFVWLTLACPCSHCPFTPPSRFVYEDRGRERTSFSSDLPCQIPSVIAALRRRKGTLLMSPLNFHQPKENRSHDCKAAKGKRKRRLKWRPHQSSLIIPPPLLFLRSVGSVEPLQFGTRRRRCKGFPVFPLCMLGKQ